MAASTEQKVDYLLKKIGFTASKTGLAEDSSLSGTKKAPFAESIPSPLVTPSTTIWNESALIPTTPPGSDTAQVKVYLAGTSGHRMTVDSTVSGSRAFIAYSTYNNTSSAILGDWIDPQFGDAYIIKVYKGDPNSGGTLLSAAGAGSNDTWFFDYSSGVLNFNGTAIPSGVTDTNIYIVGYRYIGIKGLSTAGISTDGTSVFTNLNVTGVSTFTGNINANGNIVGDNATNITGINNISASGISSASAFADFDYLQAPFGSTTTFTVTVASKDSTHRYQGQGSGNAYLINGVQAPILNLTPGRTYRFNNTNTGSHPLKFYYDANRTTLYTTGVNFQNTYTEITISDTTPNVLHYQCTNHGLMGNAIITNSNVVDSPYDATLRSGLNVTGLSTFAGNINANGNIVGDNSTNITGIAGVTATTLTGTLQTAAQPNVTSLGTLTSLNVTGDVSIGGTLTYEDVTNIDSVGLITARTGIKVLAGGINAVGVVTATSFDGSLATTNLTGTITNAQLAGSIANDKLVNDSVSFGGVSVDLGSSDATPAFDLSDATNYPFTSLTGITTTILGDATPKLGGDLNGNGKSIFNVGISSASAFADFDYLQAPFGSTTTFTVTVAGKDATHRYNGQGSGNAYIINDVQAPFLTLTPGRTYRFDTSDSSNSGHPFRFYLDVDKTYAYTTGVTVAGNAGNSGSYTEITISDTTPDVLHYQCSAHGKMGNAVTTNSNTVNTPYDATFEGLLNAKGNFQASGNVTLGDGTGDNIDVQGRFVRELVPSSNGDKDLGTSSLRWKTLHIKNILQSGGGISTFTNDIKADGNIVGDNATNISGINSVTATTYFGDGTKLIGVSTAGISTDGTATLNNLEVAGVSTFTNSIQIKSDDNTPARIDLYCESNNAHYLRLQAPPHSSFSGNPTVILPNVAGDIIVGDTSSAIDQDINTTGNITAANLTGTLQTAAQTNITSVGTLTGLDVNGHTELDTLSVSGVSTFTGNADFSNAIDVTGNVNATGNLDLPDNGRLMLGTGDDVQIYHTGSATKFDFHTSNVEFTTAGTESLAKFNLNSSVELYHDGTKKFETFAGGIQVQGSVFVQDGSASGNRFTIGTSGDLKIFHENDVNVFANNNNATTEFRADTFLVKNQANSATRFTINSSGDATFANNLNVTGITTISGNLVANGNIVGDNATNITGIAGVTASTLTGTLQTAAQPNVTSVGTLTSLNVSGDVSIGGTLTYEDVTNIDSLGIVTARTGIKVLAGGINAVGVITGTNGFSGTILTAAQPNVTSLGTLSALTVSGNINANGNIIGDDATNISGINSVTATKFFGDGTNLIGISTAGISTDGTATLNNLEVTGVSTFAGNINANGNIIGDDATNISGINSVTATKFFGNGEGLTNVGVDTGTVNTNSIDTGTLNVTGVSTFVGVSTFNNHATFDRFILIPDGTQDGGSGASIRIGDSQDMQIFHSGGNGQIRNDTGTLRIRGASDNQFSIRFDNTVGEVYANMAANGSVDLYYDNSKKFETTGYGVTVHGGAYVSGVSTFSNTSGAINANSTTTNRAINIQLNGVTKGGLTPENDGLELDVNSGDNLTMHLNQNGGSTSDFIVKSNGSELFKIDSGTIESTFTSTDAGSSAGPVVNLYRNSASPADADYLGQIKFQGESDTGVQRNYAKITGKILDASNGTEDGIIEFAHIKAGSQTITGRFRSDSLQLLNDTNLSVAGDTTLTGDLDVDGHTELDNLRVSGVSTFSDDITIPTTKQIKFNNANNSISRNNITVDGSLVDGLIIRTAGSEELILQTNAAGSGGGTFRVMSGTEHQLVANENDSVDLYFNGSKKFETTNTGVVVTGILTATSFSGDGSNLSNVGFTTSVGTFNASSGVATIDSFAYATEDYKVAEYTLHFTNGSDIQAQKLLVMQDGSTAYSQEFAVMSSGSQLVTVDATISGANVLVRATPETGISGTTTFRWRRIVQE